MPPYILVGWDALGFQIREHLVDDPEPWVDVLTQLRDVRNLRPVNEKHPDGMSDQTGPVVGLDEIVARLTRSPAACRNPRLFVRERSLEVRAFVRPEHVLGRTEVADRTAAGTGALSDLQVHRRTGSIP